MLSVDQNCHSLWDVLPKLQALARAGHDVTHYIEDIDAAFTAMGAPVNSDDLRIVRERFHRSGGADWGAAMFYTEFLGRQPVEIRDWEPLTGMKTNVLAKRLGRSVDDLYDEFSPGDNWQLIGSSFVGDREHHRVIGDLTVAQTGPFVRELLRRGRADMERAFPAAESQRRLAEWFAAEEALVERLLEELAGGMLVDLYGRWMSAHLARDAGAGGSARQRGRIGLDLTSRLFACGGAAAGPDLDEPLEAFVRDYPLAAGLYNQAVAETQSRLHPLDLGAGELPCFATIAHAGHLVRAGMTWRDGQVWIDGRCCRPSGTGHVPWESLAAAGVRCVTGKAALMVTQVRHGPTGRALALPYRGSQYMPTAHALARKLAAAGLLTGPLKPALRVRLRLLDRLRSLDTPIHLPPHLAAAMGAEEVPARRLGEAHAEIAAEAAARLAALRDEPGRQRWQAERFPDATRRLGELDLRRRELAKVNEKDPELREIWKVMRDLQADLLARTIRQIDRDTQVADLDYYDSRGAILPWCIALGGEDFYRQVIDQAEIYEESSL
jgi:hypothetical protein